MQARISGWSRMEITLIGFLSTNAVFAEENRNMDSEYRSYTIIRKGSEHGRSFIEIRCPFCGVVVIAYLWSLAGSGKLCDCGAKHTLTQGTLAPKQSVKNRKQIG
jgi:hypothetical protein